MTSTQQTPTESLTPVWREVLATSHRALADAVAGTDAEHLNAITPCSEWTVAQVIQHAAADQRAYAAALGVGPGPAYDPFAPSGTLDDPAALIAAALEESSTAWATVTDETESVPTPLPHGELPTPTAAVMCALDAAVHAWDITTATGRPAALTDGDSIHFLTAATGLVEPLRQWGAFAAIVPGRESDSPAHRLLRYLGRNPEWTAA
ncbi:TIGR03086 family metal-binding protein [Nocardia miyunensis]|uniref:TIGR03086 family metal-binding protein n=1 Tax=Nocardia miyunensis TaxID=282684 RepID=UPI000833CE4B|nr:TIGR03086 family metal-binding protein [Nocardia miyunensis]